MKKLYVSVPQKYNDETAMKRTKEDCRVIAREIEKQIGEPVELLGDGANNSFFYWQKVMEPLMAQADFAYFEEGWEGFNRCRCEHDYAVKSGVPIIRE